MKRSNDNFEYDFTLQLRSKVYEVCKILVIDMKPVIKEIDLFVKNIMLSPLKGDSKVTYRILGKVDLYVERMNETIKEYKWSVCTNQNLEHDVLNIDFDNVDEMFEPFKDSFMEIITENEISEFPKELLTKAFLCFVLTLHDIMNRSELIENEEIYGMIKIGNNGECNILL